MTVYKDQNRTGPIQKFFNCGNPTVTNGKRYSVIGDPIDTPYGIFGIATTKGLGFIGGDSNPIVPLRNGNAFMGFGDTSYGTLVQDGYWNTVAEPYPITDRVRNSFCYINVKDKKIFSNTYYFGNSEENVRTPYFFSTILNNSPPDKGKQDLYSTIIIGQSLEKTKEWASRGTQPLLTPDYSNQINYQMSQLSANIGFAWPLAGLAYLNTPESSRESVMWICSQTFTFKLEDGTSINSYQSQMVIVPDVASLNEDDILSPYEWDKNSIIVSFPDFMNSPQLIHEDPKIYDCLYQWTRSMVIDELYYLFGSSRLTNELYLVRSDNPNKFVQGTGFEAWTSEGWTLVNEHTVLKSLQLLNYNGKPLEYDNANKISEIYRSDDGYFNLLFLDSKFDLETNTTAERKVYRLLGPTISGPFFQIPEPILHSFPPQYSPYFDIYELRVSPFLNQLVEQTKDDKKLQCVFHAVGQADPDFGYLFYNGTSIYFSYFTQFYTYYE